MLRKFYQTLVCVGIVLGLVNHPRLLFQMARYNGIRNTAFDIRDIARQAYAEMREEIEFELS